MPHVPERTTLSTLPVPPVLTVPALLETVEVFTSRIYAVDAPFKAVIELRSNSYECQLVFPKA